MIAIARKSVFLAAVLLAAACGEKKEAPQPAPAERAAPPPAAAPAPTGAEAAPAPSGPAAPPAATPPATAPSTTTPTSPSAPKPTPAPTPKPTAPPATTPPAAPTAATPPPAAPAAHAKVGPEKCKMCHRLQYDSWAASPHKTKGLDCEGCHGNGGDYWSAAVMRDRAKATAAGLAIPDLAACRKCHGAKADAALYAKVHAHKAK